jgi:hypothetical protein
MGVVYVRGEQRGARNYVRPQDRISLVKDQSVEKGLTLLVISEGPNVLRIGQNFAERCPDEELAVS